MGNKPRGVPCEKLIDSLQNSNLHGVLGGGGDHDIFTHEQGMGAPALTSPHLTLDSYSRGADSHLLEFLVQNSPRGLINPVNSHGDVLLGKGGGAQNPHRHQDGPKKSWNSPTEHPSSPFYPLPGLSGQVVPPSGAADKRAFHNNTRQPMWCDRNVKPGLLTALDADKSAIQKLPMIIKSDLSPIGDALVPGDSPSPMGLGMSKEVPDVDTKNMDSSDGSDHNMDEAEEKNAGNGLLGNGRAVSKNLVSERKRRKKLNEGLYTLRALVPRISKMDKASIIGDAIDYVRELQKQVEELQGAISDMETRSVAVEEVLSSVADTSAVQVSVGVSDGRCWEEEGSKNSEDIVNQDNQELSVDSAEQKILELDVSLMEDQIYHLRIFCTKGPGVFVQLMQSLEALGLEVMTANLTSLQDNILNTFIAEIKDWEMMKTDDVKKAIMDVASRFGLQ